MTVLVVNGTVEARKLEHDRSPNPNQRTKPNQHKSSYTHVPTLFESIDLEAFLKDPNVYRSSHIPRSSYHILDTICSIRLILYHIHSIPCTLYHTFYIKKPYLL